MMLRRHYNAIAAALRSGNTTYDLVYCIAVQLQLHNPRFDYDKFMNKAISGPTQEQRSAKFKAQFARGKLRATPRHKSAAIAG